MHLLDYKENSFTIYMVFTGADPLLGALEPVLCDAKTWSS